MYVISEFCVPYSNRLFLPSHSQLPPTPDTSTNPPVLVDKLNLTSRQLYADNIAATLTASADLYNAGYHNFLFLNLPPLDRNPGNLVRDRKLPNATEIGWWDEELRTQSAAFEAAHEDARALVFDANALLHGVLDDPAPHGITNTTNFCSGRDQWPAVIENPAQFGCPVPVAEYFWFDSGHM
jgi:phospholipase/lecithinase/hemolysin